MLDIALVQERGPQRKPGNVEGSNRYAVSVVDIAARQAISASYLEQIFSKLKRAGLIGSVRGPGGGYRLAAPLAEISVSRIVAAVGDGVDATRCHGAADCLDGAKCLTHDLWAELSHEIDEFMSNITLATLVQRAEPQGQPLPTEHASANLAAKDGLDLIAARHL